MPNSNRNAHQPQHRRRGLIYPILALAGVIGIGSAALLSWVSGLFGGRRGHPRQRPIDVYHQCQREARQPEESAIAHSEDEGYELRDAEPRAILIPALGLGLTCFLILVMLAWMFRFLSGGTGAQTTDISRLTSPRNGLAVRVTPGVEPPYPRLMVNEPADMDSVRRSWNKQLSSYGWIDRKHNRVHIPIRRAMDIVANGGPKVVTTPSPTSIAPSDWNNGRR